VADVGAGPYRDRAGSARDVIALLAPELADDEALIHAVDDEVHQR
jgi:fructuronate reductase